VSFEFAADLGDEGEVLEFLQSGVVFSCGYHFGELKRGDRGENFSLLGFDLGMEFEID
jgi:hypothetical protein